MSTAIVGTYDILGTPTDGSGLLSDYSLTLNPGVLTVNTAAFTITADSAGKTYGGTLSFAGSEFTDPGLLNGDAVTSVTLTSAGSPATATVTGSPYAIVPSPDGHRVI